MRMTAAQAARLPLLGKKGRTGINDTLPSGPTDTTSMDSSSIPPPESALLAARPHCRTRDGPVAVSSTAGPRSAASPSGR
jgi:hypothetical protein